MLYEIRLHGRGGQGVVLAGRLLGEAFVGVGLYAQSFPEFGAERSGAPVTAYTRVSDERIETRSPVTKPHIVLTIDRNLSFDRNVVAGLREDGLVVANAAATPEEVRRSLGLGPGVRVAVVNATKIAMEVLGRNNPNTAVLGAFAAASKLINPELLAKAVADWFSGKVGEANAAAVMRGAKEATLG